MRDPLAQLRDFAAWIDADPPRFDPVEFRGSERASMAPSAEVEPSAAGHLPSRRSWILAAAAAAVVVLVGAALAARAGDAPNVEATSEPRSQGWMELPGFDHAVAAGELRSFERSRALWTGEEVLFVGALRQQTDRAVVLGPIPAIDPAAGTWHLIDAPPFDFLDQQYVAVWTDSELVVVGAALDADGWGTRAAAYAPGSGWRTLVNPPPEFKDVDDDGGVVWAGGEIVVSTSTGGVLAYQPTGAGTWRQVIEYDGVPYEQRRSVVWDGSGLQFFGGTVDGTTQVLESPIVAVDGVTGTTANVDGYAVVRVFADRIQPQGGGTGPGWAPVRPTWTGTRVGFLEQVPETDLANDPEYAVRDIWWATRDGGLQRDNVRFDAASPDPAIVWSGDEIVLFGGRGSGTDRAVRAGVVKDVASGDEHPLADLPEGSIPITDGLLAGDRLLGWGANPADGHSPSLRVVSIPVAEVFDRAEDGNGPQSSAPVADAGLGTLVPDSTHWTVAIPASAEPYVEVDGDPAALLEERPIVVHGSIGQPPRLAASTPVLVTVELCHFGMIEADTTCDTSSEVSVWSDLAGTFSATLAPDTSFLSRCRPANSESICAARARWVSGAVGEQAVSTPPLQFALA